MNRLKRQRLHMSRGPLVVCGVLALVLFVPSVLRAEKLPTLSVSDITVSQEACGATNAVFAVTLSQFKGKTVTVHYATANGTGVAETDYSAVSGTLVFTKSQDDDPQGTQAPLTQVITVPVTEVLIPGSSKTFSLLLNEAFNAAIADGEGVATIQAPAIAKCQSCNLSCDDGNACTADVCRAATGCKNVPLINASQPANEAFCKLSLTCAAGHDLDEDGLSDPWEASGGIDFNLDGVVTPDEMVLTNVDPIFPDGSPNPYPSADPAVKDVFLKYDWMELSDQLTDGQPTSCTVNPLPFPNNLFYPFHSDSCAWDEKCMSGVCRGHSDEPDPAALKMVIDAFAAHDIRLHLVKGHALPHADVTSMGAPIAACIQDLSTQTFYGTEAVDFYALKAANLSASYNGQNFSEAQLSPAFHYAVFGHRHTCDSTGDCQKPACVNPDTNRSPLFNEGGLAEQPGNDLLVSLGGLRDRNIEPLALVQGTFMHELGHNLGLNHGGPLLNAGQPTDPNQVSLNYKPNYISVMNYNYQALGIRTASPDCAPDDYLCKTTPASTRLDYSSFANGVIPNVLDENDGSESAGLNLGNSDIGYTWCPSQTPIPGTGPVDFNCDGSKSEAWCASGCDITQGLELNHDPAGGGHVPSGTPGSGDVLQPFEDWPNLIFTYQCQSTYNDGAAPGQFLSSGEATCEGLLEKHPVLPPRGIEITNQAVPAGVSTPKRSRNDVRRRELRRRLELPLVF
jgi:slime mold repeat-containing protein/Calx-beta domain-containing protein